MSKISPEIDDANADCDQAINDLIRLHTICRTRYEAKIEELTKQLRAESGKRAEFESIVERLTYEPPHFRP